VGQHPGLSRAGAGQDQQRALALFDGLALGRFVRDHFLVLLALYVALFAVGFWLVIVRG